jgi:hypothetical protein
VVDDSSQSAAGARLLPRAHERPDPVLEVTGTAAADILRRCGEIRKSNGLVAARPMLQRTVARMRLRARGGRRLLDFADLGNADFVRDAHRVLLGRSASPADMDRRLRELGAGSTRMELVVRLALCPEGRSAFRPPVRGIGLPALAATATAIEVMNGSAVLGRAVARGERVSRAVLAQPASPRPTKLVVAAATVVAVAVAARRSRS